MKKLRTAAILLFAWSLLLSAGCPSSKNNADSEASDPTADRQASIARLEAAVKANPQDKSARQDLVVLLLQEAQVASAAKDNAKADQLFSRIFEVDPENQVALITHGRMMIESGRAKEGLASLEKLMRANPQYSAILYNLLADGYLKTGEVGKAREALLKSLTISPASFHTYKKLAEVYRMEGNTEEAQRQDTEAQAIEKYGYPDRGYLTKTIEEWSLEAATGQGPGMGMGTHETEAPGATDGGTAETSAGGPGSGHGPGGGHGPGAQRRALARYNLATYFDRQIDPADIFTYDAAMKAWQSYIQLAKNIPEESTYLGIAKDRVHALKKAKKDRMKEIGMMPLEGVLSASRKLNEGLKGLPAALGKIKAAAEAAGDAQTAAQAQALLDQVLAIDPMAYQDRLRNINHQVMELMRKWQAKDPTLPEDKMKAEANRLGAELETIQKELKDKGVDQFFVEMRKMGTKYNVKIPKHGGEE